MTSKLPGIKLNFPILREAAKLYTPEVFELFQAEFELSGSAHIECLEGNTYMVDMCDIDNETQHKSGQVVWTREDQTVSCSCKKYEREGILCWHALKVLNYEDIKVIPTRYVLNRLTKVVTDVTVVDIEERRVTEDSPLDVRIRYAHLVRTLTSIIDMVQNEEEAQFVHHGLLALCREYEEYKKYKKLPRTSGEGNSTFEHSLHDRHLKRNLPQIEKLPSAKKGKNKSQALDVTGNSVRTGTDQYTGTTRPSGEQAGQSTD